MEQLKKIFFMEMKMLQMNKLLKLVKKPIFMNIFVH